MKKKIVALSLIFGMAAWALAGCGNSAPAPVEETKDMPASEAVEHFLGTWYVVNNDGENLGIELTFGEPFSGDNSSGKLTIVIDGKTENSTYRIHEENGTIELKILHGLTDTKAGLGNYWIDGDSIDIAFEDGTEWILVYNLAQSTDPTESMTAEMEEEPEGEPDNMYEVPDEEMEPGFPMDEKIFTMGCVSGVSASSSLSEYDMTHKASYLIDGSLTNAWVEGVNGNGVGEYFTVELDDTYGISGFDINNGYQKSEDLFSKNSRLREIRIDFSDGTSEVHTLSDSMGSQTVFFDSLKRVCWFKVTINSVYEGWKYQDTCVSEIEIF